VGVKAVTAVAAVTTAVIAVSHAGNASKKPRITSMIVS